MAMEEETTRTRSENITGGIHRRKKTTTSSIASTPLPPSSTHQEAYLSSPDHGSPSRRHVASSVWSTATATTSVGLSKPRRSSSPATDSPVSHLTWKDTADLKDSRPSFPMWTPLLTIT
ncbi:hypothetical protein L1987_58621 [Smallanthus sonchifolius]|uniref:Uncharacterized protein n=1 Tax=Smallanthus sonchifolius TaxID=185202 RepID=A0ACB9DG24_9ASTR|nr:hypothetical protein L1987_58621 [Smallanthus sonchifolius]